MFLSREANESQTNGTVIMLDSPQLSSAPVIKSVFEHYLDAFWVWLGRMWSQVTGPYVTTPVIILFVLPAVIYFLFYCSALTMYFYSQRDRRLFQRLKQAFQEHDLYTAGMEIVTVFWDSLGWIWYGYEVVGMENIPEEGSAMIFYYHGALPVDYYFLVAKIFIQKGRIIHSVVDRFLFKICGLKTFLKAFQCTPGSQESCTEELNSGHIIGLSPGGVYEAQFGDSNYEIMWKKRVGFAKIVLGTRCRVIPVFTQNVREAFRTPAILRKLLKPIYNWTRLPIVPVYGGLPVKLKTYIGPPVTYDPETCTPEELRDLCRESLQRLIEDHQKKPGNMLRALYQRFFRDRDTLHSS